jgi:biotin synthase
VTNQTSSASVRPTSVIESKSPIRTDWTRQEVAGIYHTRLMDLIYQSASMHRLYHDPQSVQQCTLLSIKTGACPEDCAYCPQSARYKTPVKPEGLLSVESVVAAAQLAKDAGSTRFCMGAAWRDVKDDESFETVLEMVRQVNSLGLEACCTLGMLTANQASRLKEAGLYAYNHNLDTSESFYDQIITTRTYQDRLETLKNVRNAGITVCCGGILGMGETDDDRIDLLHTLATLPEHPESVPINTLVAVEGTPLQNQAPVSPLELVRMIATARILMPRAMVRLSAGRVSLSVAEQALCFFAGANSIHTGEKLLTTPNCGVDEDHKMFEAIGLEALPHRQAVQV